MNNKRRFRMLIIICLLLLLGLATTFALKAFNENLMYFFSTSDVVSGKAPSNRPFRLGGMVVKGSVIRDDHDLKVHFTLTDFKNQVPVQYTGILPDLFREGQGVVANGTLSDNGVFIADEVLAKHDENYMPPELANSIQLQSQP